MKVASVDNLKGEAGVSIRKGKKIVSYDYNCKLKWDLVVRDGDGNEVGKINGTYELPEVSNDIEDDGDEWEVRSGVKEDPNNLKARFDNLIRKEIPNALRKAIREDFVNQLKAK